MPVWLQMTAVLSSAVLSGVMGIALIPFLKKYHFCDPDTNSEKQNSETISESKVKPTMCGILLIFGCVAGFVLSDTLYLQFCGADRTSTEFQTESFHIRITMIHCLVFGILGWLIDYQRTIRKKFYLEELDSIVNLLVFFLNYVFLKFSLEDDILDFGFFQWDAGFLNVPVKAGLLTFFWYIVQRPEEDVDGISITIGSIQLLSLTVLCIAGEQHLNALYALTSAGACLGCYYWNLYPARCRIGQTGTYWLGIVIPVICVNYGKLNSLLLCMAVWLLNWIPSLFCKKTLMELLRKDGKSPVQRIVILAGFALFCSILSVIPNKGGI